jgi:uncharacterized RDD family membrane protein YckC
MSTTPPGWYPDPDAGGGQRWWDGQQWTEHSAPGAAPAPAQYAGPQTGGYAPPPPGFQPGGYAQPQAAYGPAGPGGLPRPYAGWWSRVGASVLDALILVVPVVVVALVVGALSGGRTVGEQFLGSVLGLVIAFAYWALTMPRQGERNGQSIGMQVVGIRVVRVDGQPVTVGLVALRQTLVQGILFGWFGAALLLIPWLLNYLWPLWDDENRCLHDMICSTRVVTA